MTVTSTTPQWVMETMPSRRNMGDMILLPTRNVLIINGAQQGSQGWGAVFANPTLDPVAYLPKCCSRKQVPDLHRISDPKSVPLHRKFAS